MWCARYKYRMLMEREEWVAPSVYEELIIVLCTKINSLKSSTSSKNAHKNKRGSKKRGIERSSDTYKKISQWGYSTCNTE